MNLATHLLVRARAGLGTLFIVLTLAFLLMRFAPGDPAQAWLGDQATPELVAQMRVEMGLDRSLPVQYWAYVSNVFRGDLGYSFYNNRPVLAQIAEQFAFTAMVAAGALLVAICVGIPLGLLAGFRRGSYLDLAILSSSVTAISMPSFWLGLLLLVIFSINLGWFPLIGAGDRSSILSVLHHLVLPAFALGIRSAAVLARMTRSAAIEVLAEDYVRTARAKGVSALAIASGHVLRNVWTLVISIVSLEVSLLLGGVVVIEKVFSRPGIGALLVDSVLSRDYPIVQGVLLFMAIIVVSVHLLTDLSYAIADPRIRYS